LNGKIWLPMNDTGYTFVIVLVIVWYLFRLVSRDWGIASLNPLFEFRIIFCASQSAFTIIVNASVNLLIVRIAFGYHFVNHNSALHAR
jgi:hypothetical protein